MIPRIPSDASTIVSENMSEISSLRREPFLMASMMSGRNMVRSASVLLTIEVFDTVALLDMRKEYGLNRFLASGKSKNLHFFSGQRNDGQENSMLFPFSRPRSITDDPRLSNSWRTVMFAMITVGRRSA